MDESLDPEGIVVIDPYLFIKTIKVKKDGHDVYRLIVSSPDSIQQPSHIDCDNMGRDYYDKVQQALLEILEHLAYMYPKEDFPESWQLYRQQRAVKDYAWVAYLDLYGPMVEKNNPLAA